MTLEALSAELDRWDALGKRATLWWRDDDAGADAPALRRLLALAEAHRVPLALAVIPARLGDDAASAIAACAVCAVVQHGIAHANHAPPGEKRCELGMHRPLDDVAEALARARDRLTSALAAQFLPVLVPPWNRIAPGVVAALPALGYRGLSTFGPRAAAAPADGLVRINAHVDPIAWRRDRSFVGDDEAAARLAAHLAARRDAKVDPDEPTGLLTHHLDFDAAAWRFVEALFALTRGHRAAEWVSPADAFELERARPTSGR